MLAAWGLFSRGLKEGNYAVLRETNMPATLGELALDGPVIVETMAIWCSSCRALQQEAVAAAFQEHQLARKA